MSLWRNVGKALGGTVIAQLVPVLGSLVIARQYAPAHFGTFAAWFGIAMVLSVAITGRFETVLAIEPDGEPRRHAAGCVLRTVLLACLPCAVIVAAAALLTDMLPVALWLPLVPAAALIAAAQTWQSWAAADGRYGVLGGMRIGQAVSVTALQIAVGVVHPKAETLAWAHVGGVLLAVVFSAFVMRPAWRQGWQSLTAFWGRHRRFPQYSLPADAVNTAAVQLPVMIVAGRFGAEAAGLLAMTLRTLGAPIGLLGKSVLDVFKRYASEAWRNRGECRAEYLSTLRTLVVGSVLAGVTFLLVGEQLFVLAFGEPWRGAGTMAIWLLPLFVLRFVASPLSYMVYIAGKQHLDLIWQIALLIATVATLYAGSSLAQTLVGYSVAYSLLYVVYLFMSYRFACGTRMPA